MSKFYAGIGSRTTPIHIQYLMAWIGKKLEDADYTLRSGAAPGADSAFEEALEREAEVYLPWKGFNDHTSVLTTQCEVAFKLAEEFHKGWQYLSAGAKKLMARNVYQVLGKNLKTPVDFVVCWTPDGCESTDTRTKATGGTGQAIDIASSYNIQVFNLANENALERLLKYIKKLNEN